MRFTSNTNGIDYSGSYDMTSNLCMKAVYPYTSTLIQIQGPGSALQLGSTFSGLTLWAVGFGTSFGGTAIQIGSSSVGGTQFDDSFNQVYITSDSFSGGFRNGILLNASSSPINDDNTNFFTNIRMYPAVQHGIWMANTGGRSSSMTGNVFNGVSVELNYLATTKCAYIDGDSNIIENLDCYDTVSSPSPFVINGAGSSFGAPNYIQNVDISGLGNATVSAGSFYLMDNFGQVTEGVAVDPFLGSGNTATVVPSSFGKYTGGSSVPTNKVVYTVVGQDMLFTCSGGTVTKITILYHTNTFGTYTSCASLPQIWLPYSYQINFTYSVPPTVSVWQQ